MDPHLPNAITSWPKNNPPGNLLYFTKRFNQALVEQSIQNCLSHTETKFHNVWLSIAVSKKHLFAISHEGKTNQLEPGILTRRIEGIYFVRDNQAIGLIGFSVCKMICLMLCGILYQNNEYKARYFHEK